MTRSTPRLLLLTTALTTACANTTETRTDVVVARTPVKLPPREEDWTLRAKHTVTNGVLSMTLTRAEACEETGERVTIETRAQTRAEPAALLFDAAIIAGGLVLLVAPCDKSYTPCVEHIVSVPLVLGGLAALTGDAAKASDKVIQQRTEDRRTTVAAPVCREERFSPAVLLVSFDDKAPEPVRADALGFYRLPWPSPAPSRVTLSVPNSPLRGAVER